MSARVTSLAALAAASFAAAAPLDSFQPPVAGYYASGADLGPAVQVPDVEACASLCLSIAGCISMHVCANSTGGGLGCGVSGWSMGYTPVSAGTCSWYRRITPRNDTRITQAVPWLLEVPTGGVSVLSGPLAEGFTVNVEQYLKVRDPLDMLYFFAERAGVANPPGQCFGWGGWIKGSEAGNYLMGAGGALRFTDDAELRANVQQVVDGIASYADPVTGWLWAFKESDIWADNLPDYCAGWVTRGLIDAEGAGINGSLALSRQAVSLFNNHTRLPWFLPPNGGPNPVLPYPSGFNNVTVGGYGQAYGHMIYIQFQGIIKHTLMALSPLGTQADLDIVEDLYTEQWWIQALLDMDPYHAIWHRQFFSHNYEVTAYEAFLDMYVLTGNTTYLQAMFNAWSMLRAQWILPGGSFALNEGSYYPPGSYYIGFTGINVASAHNHSHGHGHSHSHSHHDHEEAESADPYFHSKCMNTPGADEQTAAEHVSPLQALRRAAMAPAPEGKGPNDSDPPTGELCGSVFWTKFNQRFHRLYPDNETFVAEMERSIFNVGLAAQGRPGSGGEGPNGTGIRYFANYHKQKQNPSMHASCCEGQGTRLFGSLPEYIFTTGPASNGVVSSVRVDLFADASFTFAAAGGQGTLVQSTQWPYGTDVTLSLTLPAQAAAGPFDLAVRIPFWVAAPSVQVSVNGKAWPTAGVPGSYLHLTGPWAAAPAVTNVTFSLPMALSESYYTGHSQLPPYQRYAYLYGPILLAAEGPWNSTVDALVMPSGLDPTTPSAWMVPAGDGNALHFNVSVGGNANSGFIYKPYFEIQESGEHFDVFALF